MKKKTLKILKKITIRQIIIILAPLLLLINIYLLNKIYCNYYLDTYAIFLFVEKIVLIGIEYINNFLSNVLFYLYKTDYILYIKKKFYLLNIVNIIILYFILNLIIVNIICLLLIIWFEFKENIYNDIINHYISLKILFHERINIYRNIKQDLKHILNFNLVTFNSPNTSYSAPITRPDIEVEKIKLNILQDVKNKIENFNLISNLVFEHIKLYLNFRNKFKYSLTNLLENNTIFNIIDDLENLQNNFSPSMLDYQYKLEPGTR